MPINDCDTHTRTHSPLFYQGKLDSFCALYAVLNALTITHGLSLSSAIPLFREILLHMSADNERWHNIVHNATDFLWLVEDALNIVQFRGYLLDIERPWRIGAEQGPCTEKICWREMVFHLPPTASQAGAAIFRFHRFIPDRKTPIISHWTVGEKINQDILLLRDSSHEPAATREIHCRGFCTKKEKVNEKAPIFIEPATIFFIRPAIQNKIP